MYDEGPPGFTPRRWTASEPWSAHKLTWLGDSRDHQGGNPIVRPLHCTFAWADLCGSFSLRLANS
ncbi:unnamed protein product [Heligmosomoides polygyrus]|uniref:Uncharacterized protein n=1 Tax=Heligmosomoides polygyrus TaxID=6339 RepID=A0A183FTN1_HELPZ|nr:unnamed protein product [Heligmosomoides polygyrus]